MSRKFPSSRISPLAGTGLHVLDNLQLTDDTATLAARTALAAHLSALIEARTACRLPRVVPQTLSLIRGYRLRRLPIDHLLRALLALDQHIEIVVHPGKDGEAARMGVTVTEACGAAASALPRRNVR